MRYAVSGVMRRHAPARRCGSSSVGRTASSLTWPGRGGVSLDAWGSPRRPCFWHPNRPGCCLHGSRWRSRWAGTSSSPVSAWRSRPIIYVMHRRGIVRDDPVALGLAKRWAKVSAVLFAIGAVSGTVLSFEMGLLWPGLMGRFGDVLGLPFAFEGLSFFVEAIFLGIYLYGWDRMPPRRHLAMLIPMGRVGHRRHVLRGVGECLDEQSRRVSRSATAWSPTSTRGGRCSTTASGFSSCTCGLAAFMVVGLVVSGVYAAGLLRGRTDAHHRLGFTVPFVFANVAAIAQPLVGHVLGMRIARHPAGEARGVRACRDDREARAASAGRPADRRRGAVGAGHSAARLDHRAQLVRRDRCPGWTRCPSPTGRRSTSPTWPSSRWWSSARCWRPW